MKLKMNEFVLLSILFFIARIAFADVALGNCAFNGSNLRAIGGTQVECTRASNGEEVTVAMPLSEKLGTFKNIKLRVMLDQGDKPAVDTFAYLEVQNPDTEIRTFGSALYYGGVCPLQVRDRKNFPDLYEKCRVEMLADQMTALKELLKSTLLVSRPPLAPQELLLAIEAGVLNGKKIMGIWIVFDSSDNSL